MCPSSLAYRKCSLTCAARALRQRSGIHTGAVIERNEKGIRRGYTRDTAEPVRPPCERVTPCGLSVRPRRGLTKLQGKLQAHLPKPRAEDTTLELVAECLLVRRHLLRERRLFRLHRVSRLGFECHTNVCHLRRRCRFLEQRVDRHGDSCTAGAVSVQVASRHVLS